MNTLAFIAIAFISSAAMAYLAIRNISRGDSPLLITSQKISKALIMRVLDQVESNLGSATYAPTPFDSPDFAYADLSHPYFEKIRNDKRVAHFYSNHEEPIDFSGAISIREYLRDLFPHGFSSTNYLNANVLEMIDAAEQGEKFACGDISKMLVQLIQAGGTQGRIVGLETSHSGHVVVELWSRRFNKWIYMDPDYNLHYTNATDTPLSALELYEMYRDSHKIEDIKHVTGNSPNTLYKDNIKIKSRELFYKGLAIHFYNRWVDKNLPRRHPASSPSIMGFYIGKSVIEKFYYKHNSEVLDDEIRSKLYKKPLLAKTEYEVGPSIDVG